MQERMNRSVLIAPIFCNPSPSAMQHFSHVRKRSCCALHVSVLFTLLGNFHMQSRRRGKPLLIELKMVVNFSKLPFRSSMLSNPGQQVPRTCHAFENAGPFTGVVDRAPFMFLTFSRYLKAQILGKREAKAAILEDILPSLDGARSWYNTSWYMTVDKGG